MDIKTFNYAANQGWSIDGFPPLDSNKTLVFVFGAPKFIDHPEPINELCEYFSSSHIIGCSSSGEIFGTTVNDNSLSVAVINFTHTTLKTTSATIEHPKDSFNVGAQLSKEINDPDLKGLIVLSDGINVNGSDLVKGLSSNVSNKVIITGGLAGDADHFKKTWVINKEKQAKTNTITVVGLYGDRLHIGYGTNAGWDIFGPERLITRSKGNVLYEIDDQPALTLYKKYLGDRASGLPGTALLFPLAIREKSTDEDKIIRTILSVDETEQSMTFAGNVPEGWHAQLMRANREGLIEAASVAGKMAAEVSHIKEETPSLTIAISCVGRRMVLGERVEEEVEAILEKLPKLTQLVGFYSYGEISPSGVTVIGKCELHNQTMTLTTLYEE